jgi:competence protein ComFC
MRIYSFLSFFFNILFGESSKDAQIARVSKHDLEKQLHISMHETYNAVSCFSYRSPTIRTLIHALKYNGNYRAADLLAPFLAEVILDKLGDNIMFYDKAPLLIPIPLSKEKLKERGYNQAEILTQEIVKYLQNIHGTILPIHTEILFRIKNTPSQTALSKPDRKRNLIGAFAVHSASAVQNESIILIDDVLTTGSTLHEARQTLLKAGAKNVSAITVAH